MSFKKVEFNSVGELIDAVMDGREIYNSTKEYELAHTYSLNCFTWNIGKKIITKIDLGNLKRDLKSSTFFEKCDWRETVSSENPVWCWGNDDKTQMVKVVGYEKDLPCPYFYFRRGHYHSTGYAEPITKEEFQKLADYMNE